jgi:hypothetical protein
MPQIKITGNQQIDISQEEANKIKPLLLEHEPPEFIQVQGQPIKTAKIIGVFEDQPLPATFQGSEFYWSDEELVKWEEDIFKYHDTFKSYLISQGAWLVNEWYPNGAVRRPQLYRMLIAKWNKLNELRWRREKKTGFKGAKKQITEIKRKLSLLRENMSIPKPLTKKQETSEEVQRQETVEKYQSIKEPQDGIIDVDKIPF